MSSANCGLPCLLGGEIESHEDLILQTPTSLQERFNLDVRVHHAVIAVDTAARVAIVEDKAAGKVRSESEEADAINSWIEGRKPRRAVVAGGGFIGLETAEQLVRRGLAVTVIDGLDHVLASLDPEMAELVHRELRKHGVRLGLVSPIKEFKEPGWRNGNQAAPQAVWVVAGDQEPIPADLVLPGLGIRPEIALARQAGLTIGSPGGIRVDEHLQTSAAGVWAAGDAIEVLHPVSKQWTRIALGGPANRQGRIVADNIFGAGRTYDGTFGTAILRVFDLTVASTGLNEQQLRTAGIAYEAIHVHPFLHASYYPGAERLAMKVLFRKEGGQLLGAQVIGKDGAHKRIDVIATAMKAGMTIGDLADLELAYAPPFGAAKDAINLAGMTGSNVLEGTIEQVQPQQLPELEPDRFVILDVRSGKERERGCIPNSMHIPLPELRRRLGEIPAGKTVIVSCQSGQRSYYASRLLAQKGFAVYNLAGGYLTWKAAADAAEARRNVAAVV